MAFTLDQVQGVFGEFKPVLDGAGGTFTADQVQGIFGEFKPVLDIAQTAAASGGQEDWPVLTTRSKFSTWRYS